MNLGFANKVSNEIRQRVKTWPHPINIIAKGLNGAIFLTNDGRAMKIVKGTKDTEIQMLRALRDTGFVPKISHAYSGSNYTAFIMNYIHDGMTLKNYIESRMKEDIDTNLYQKISDMVKVLHSRGISHGDLHTGNIIVTFTPSGRVKDVFLIDFTRSLKFNTTENQLFKKMYKISENQIGGGYVHFPWNLTVRRKNTNLVTKLNNSINVKNFKKRVTNSNNKPRKIRTGLFGYL